MGGVCILPPTTETIFSMCSWAYYGYKAYMMVAPLETVTYPVAPSPWGCPGVCPAGNVVNTLMEGQAFGGER